MPARLATWGSRMIVIEMTVPKRTKKKKKKRTRDGMVGLRGGLRGKTNVNVTILRRNDPHKKI